MDAIIRHAQAQGEIFEALTFFKKAVAALEKEKTPEYLKKIRTLFERDIVEHFKTEENEIFPIVLSSGTLLEKRIIRSLQRDHIDVLEKIDEVKEYLLKCGAHPNEKQTRELTALNKDIIELMLTHSRKEDKELFPLLKSIGCRIEANRMKCK